MLKYFFEEYNLEKEFYNPKTVVDNVAISQVFPNVENWFH